MRLPDVPVTATVYVPAGVPLCPTRAAVEIVSLELAELFPGVTEAGENEQLEAVGRFEQRSETAEPKVPPSAAAVTVYVADLPAMTVAPAGEAEIE